MAPPTQSDSLPVWRCPQSNLCGAQWATPEPGDVCPFCHMGPVESTGFSLDQLAAAADHFGFEGQLPVHVPQPVPELVQLSTLPMDLWIGLPVFHPLSQTGTWADWRAYDVGVIVDVVAAPEEIPGEHRCQFLYSIGGESGTLSYGASNLWVPATLAQRLVGDGATISKNQA